MFQYCLSYHQIPYMPAKVPAFLQYNIHHGLRNEYSSVGSGSKFFFRSFVKMFRNHVANSLPPISFCNMIDRKSTRLNSSHVSISYAVFCLKKKKTQIFLTMLILTLDDSFMIRRQP